MKPQVQGDVQGLPLGAQIVTALQGRPVATTAPIAGQSLAWNGAAWAPGGRLGSGSFASSVSTAGTTFAAGADLLPTAITFTATKGNSYIVTVSAEGWQNSGANQNALKLNLDGADGGTIAVWNCTTAGFANTLLVRTIFTPSPGSHTVNARLFCGAGTATVLAGPGGVGAGTPILVTLEVL